MILISLYVYSSLQLENLTVFKKLTKVKYIVTLCFC